MPPKPHHHKRRHHPARLENEERERTPAEIGERLEKMGRLLRERGHFVLGSSDVNPPEACKFIMRLERTPKGELSLRLEMVWEEPEEEEPDDASDELEIR